MRAVGVGCVVFGAHFCGVWGGVLGLFMLVGVVWLWLWACVAELV